MASALYTGYSVLQGEERKKWLDRGRAAADRSLQLDPGLPEAHTADGALNWYNRDFEAAVTAFELAPPCPMRRRSRM